MGLAPSSARQSDGQAFLHGLANFGILLGKAVLTAAATVITAPTLPLTVASFGKTVYEFVRDPTNEDHLQVAGLDTIIDAGKDIVENVAGKELATVTRPVIDGAHAAINHIIKGRTAEVAPGMVPPSEMMKIADPQTRVVRAISQRPGSVAHAHNMIRGAQADASLLRAMGGSVAPAKA